MVGADGRSNSGSCLGTASFGSVLWLMRSQWTVWPLWATLGYADKVRTQFLSLRQLLSASYSPPCPGVGLVGPS